MALTPEAIWGAFHALIGFWIVKFFAFENVLIPIALYRLVIYHPAVKALLLIFRQPRLILANLTIILVYLSFTILDCVLNALALLIVKKHVEGANLTQAHILVAHFAVFDAFDTFLAVLSGHRIAPFAVVTNFKALDTTVIANIAGHLTVGIRTILT